MASSKKSSTTNSTVRLEVKKTYKLFINGAFPRSESGRVYEVVDCKGAYNRGQILYRIAEMLEGRREQFASEIALASGVTQKKALDEVSTAIDRWVWYAGWSDKLSAAFGSTNPVSGPYYNFTIPEPQGVIAVAPSESFLALIDAIAPAIVSGNSAIALAPGSAAIAAMTFAEVLATSDLPAGVINILTGSHDELAPWAASHMDIDGFDISGVDKKKRAEIKVAGAENLKRIHSFDGAQSPSRIFAFMEAKTVWHPIGV
jgi:acyl-CoA reductase-like NAD-dependent aldehyde dehydrogenase